MSAFQYYEFRAIDRRLTKDEQAELRAISPRAEITSTSFTSESSWGDLEASPADLVGRYFDAHFYLDSWGSRALIFRFPAQIVDVEDLGKYRLDNFMDVWSHGPHTLLRIDLDHECHGDDWWLHQDSLTDLIELRGQIARGDSRAPYLAWLNYAAA